MGSIREIVFDCETPSVLARFWAEMLDGYAVRPYDQAEIDRLAELGLTPETDPTVMVDGPGPVLCFQRVAGRKYENNRRAPGHRSRRPAARGPAHSSAWRTRSYAKRPATRHARPRATFCIVAR